LARDNLDAVYGEFTRFKEEIEVCQKAIKINPDDAEAYFNLGAVYGKFGHLEEAIEAYKKALEIKPGYTIAQQNLDKARTDLQKTHGRFELQEEIIQIDNKNITVCNQQGISYIESEDYEKAVKVLKECIKISPDFAEAYFNLAKAYGGLGRADIAVGFLKQAIRIKPDFVDAHYHLGSCYIVVGKSSEFQQRIRRMEKKLNIEGEAYGALTQDLQKLGGFEEAIESFKQVIRLKPDYPNAHRKLGEAYIGLSQFEEAIEAYKEAINLNPKDTKAYEGLGVAFGNLDRKEEMIQSFEQIVKLTPEDPNAYCNLGAVYLSLDRHKQAISTYKQAIDVKTELPQAHVGLGAAYLKSGDKDAAMAEYEILKTLDKNLANKLLEFINKREFKKEKNQSP